MQRTVFGQNNFGSALFADTSAEIHLFQSISRTIVRSAAVKWMVIRMANKKRLIDANKLKTKAIADPDSGEGIVYVQDIDEAPTVDVVEVVHGHWILRQENSIYDMTYQYECSQCAQPNRSQTNYCPNCGSKMNGDDDE